MTNFRRWATERLKEYMIKGFTMDDERLKNLGGENYWMDIEKCRGIDPRLTIQNRLYDRDIVEFLGLWEVLT